MNRKMKIALIVAAALCAVGLILFLIAFAMADFNIQKLGNERYTVNRHDVTERFEDIVIKSDTSDVTFTLSKDNSCYVLLNENEKTPHTVSVEDGTLVIKQRDERKWYEYISIFSFGKKSVTVCLPKAQYDSLSVDISTGDVRIPAEVAFEEIDINASTGDVSIRGSARMERLSVKLSTGEIEIANVISSRISLTTSTGDIDLKSTVADEKLEIRTSTGEVELERVDAPDIVIHTTTGDVEASLLSPKQFSVDTSTGRVRVPKSQGTQRCTVTTSTGDVEIVVKD